MSIPGSLRRLSMVREAEEKEIGAQLSSAIAELRCLEDAICLAKERSHRARSLLMESIRSDEPECRVFALLEIATSDRDKTLLKQDALATERRIETIQAKLLAKRTERRQAETLVEAAAARDAAASIRRTQATLDEWHRSRAKASVTSKHHAQDEGRAAPGSA